MQTGAKPLALAVFVVALAAASWHANQVPAHPGFPPESAAEQPSPPTGSTGRGGWQTSEMLPGIGKDPGAPTLAALPNGQLAAAWTAVSRSEEIGRPEQAAIWFSLRTAHGWQEPVPIATRETTAGALFAHIRQIDTPILQEHDGVLHLWFAARGFAGARWHQLAHRLSADSGKHWSPVQAISHHPLALPGHPAGQPAHQLNYGEIAFPTTQAAPDQQQAWLRIAPEGRILSRFWQPPPELPERHAASPYAQLELGNGQKILVGNPPTGSNSLVLWLHNGDTSGWKKMKTLESANDPQADFSQPSLALAPDGSIHLAYTWRGQGIRLLSFNRDWINGDSQ